MDRRVVVTGLGVVTSLGIGKNIFWNNLIQGKTGISKVTSFDTSLFSREYAGEIQNFSPSDYIKSHFIKYLGRASQFAIIGTKLAVEDASLSLEDIRGKNTGIIIGTTLPEGKIIDHSSPEIVKNSGREVDNYALFNLFAPGIVRNVADFFKIEGRNILIPNACAAGNYTIGYAFDLIRKGYFECVIVGGTEAISRFIFQGFRKLFAVAKDKCMPFDKNRQGMLVGEGSGILVLESFDSAKDRESSVYAEILGYGLSCDAFHITIPKREGIQNAIQNALDNANISPGDIDYISAHGTGTQANDKEEVAAIKAVFKEHTKKLPVSSIKSMLGHCMGAASAIEAVTCCLCLRDNILPPTINFSTPDPECDIDCVPNESRKKEVQIVLNNGFAFGGNNCCVLFKKYSS